MKLRKLSFIIALALTLTVGGVYATWSYAGTNDIADSFAEAKVTITNFLHHIKKAKERKVVHWLILKFIYLLSNDYGFKPLLLKFC